MLAAIWVPIVAYRRPEASDCRVAVISGGGSGHEPAHTGFVRRGLLDAAVCGSIFASPHVKQIRRAPGTDTGPNSGGVLEAAQFIRDDKAVFSELVNSAR